MTPPMSEELRWPGVAPDLIVSQVRNTSPFIFEEGFSTPYSDRVVAASQREWIRERADLAEYFALLASAHYSTVATFVPTDFDATIRVKLWSHMNTEERRRAGEWVLSSADFDFAPVSERWVADPQGRRLHGHMGEWFSMAVAAFAANRRHTSDVSQRLAERIGGEVVRHAEILAALIDSQDGIPLLKAVTITAHNLGDLDRVYEAWGIAPGDRQLGPYFRTGHVEGAPSSEPWRTILSVSGGINTEMMADENHRHFVLRKPRCLRRHRELLLPIGPFFDDWGTKVARHPGLDPAEVGEVVEALIDGWERLGGYGYARALAGMEGGFAGGGTALWREIPARHVRLLRTGTLRNRISEERFRFERRWIEKVNRLVKERLIKTPGWNFQKEASDRSDNSPADRAWLRKSTPDQPRAQDSL